MKNFLLFLIVGMVVLALTDSMILATAAGASVAWLAGLDDGFSMPSSGRGLGLSESTFEQDHVRMAEAMDRPMYVFSLRDPMTNAGTDSGYLPPPPYGGGGCGMG